MVRKSSIMRLNIQEELKWFHFIMLTIAGSINAFGVTIFLYPVKLYDSGISGVSMLLDQVTPPYLSISLFLLVINIPIFLFGLKRQGFAFTVYSVYSVAIYSQLLSDHVCFANRCKFCITVGGK